MQHFICLKSFGFKLCAIIPAVFLQLNIFNEEKWVVGWSLLIRCWKVFMKHSKYQLFSLEKHVKKKLCFYGKF